MEVQREKALVMQVGRTAAYVTDSHGTSGADGGLLLREICPSLTSSDKSVLQL